MVLFSGEANKRSICVHVLAKALEGQCAKIYCRLHCTDLIVMGECFSSGHALFFAVGCELCIAYLFSVVLDVVVTFGMADKVESRCHDGGSNGKSSNGSSGDSSGISVGRN